MESEQNYQLSDVWVSEKWILAFGADDILKDVKPRKKNV